MDITPQRFDRSAGRPRQPRLRAASTLDQPQGDDEIVARALAILSRRLRTGPILTSPQLVRDYLRCYFSPASQEGHEEFAILLFDANHHVLEVKTLFRGTLTQTSVYPREIVKAALRVNAAALVCAHNHPSGEPEPSRADEFLTQTLKSALQLVDCRLLDHFVVTDAKVVSFAERGLL
jgi:DNA repair protein RadC